MSANLSIKNDWDHRLEVANIKYKALTGRDVNFRTFQTEVDQLYLLAFFIP